MESILRIVAIGGLAVELEVNLYVSGGAGGSNGLMRPFLPGISGQQPEITGLCSMCPVREGERSSHFELSLGHSTCFPSDSWVEGRGWSREEEKPGGESWPLGLYIWSLVTSLAPHMAGRLGGERLSPSLSGIG